MSGGWNYCIQCGTGQGLGDCPMCKAVFDKMAAKAEAARAKVDSVPPANPRAFPVGRATLSEGMTLRDYFAAAALTGMLAWRAPDDVATLAYEVADAMLAARESKP